MPFEYETTRDRSDLIKETGYWSGEAVYFNVSPNRIIILDDGLTAAGVKEMVEAYLEGELKGFIVGTIKSIMDRNKKSLLDVLKDNTLTNYWGIADAPSFGMLKLKGKKGPSWPSLADWFTERNESESSELKFISELLTGDILAGYPVTRHHNFWGGLHGLCHPWMQDSLDAWTTKNISLESVLTSLAVLSFQGNCQCGSRRSIKEFAASTDEMMAALRHTHMAIPVMNTRKDLLLTTGVCSGSAVLLGLLAARGKILLPPSIEPGAVMSTYPEFQAWADYSIQSINSSRNKSHKRTMLFRMLASSTVRSIADIPKNVSDIMLLVPAIKLLNSTLSPMLTLYASEQGLEPFPLQNLHGKKRLKQTPKKYTKEWLVAEGVPVPWLDFSTFLRSASQTSEKQITGQLQTVIDWAWFERRFPSPDDVVTTDLRDPHNPDRRDTFYHYISKKGVGHKSPYWTNASSAFRLVYNACQLESCGQGALLQKNPFELHSNPFPGVSRSTTHRHRIPNNVHEAMLQVLLSPDEEGRPTYSFVRDNFPKDFFDWEDPSTGDIERVWCPSRASMLALLLVLPIRTKQARWLDQGLLDQRVWDMEKGEYVENKHPLKDFHYPNGNTHHEAYGRPSGVFQTMHDQLHGREQLCIFVNTNKTQMWNPEQTTGYEIWWPRGDELREVDVAAMTKQAEHLDRPYDTIESQGQWMMKHDPNPVPVTFADSKQDHGAINWNLKDLYPYFTPLFRDMSSPYYKDNGERYYLPVGRGKLEALFHTLAVYTEERLLEQGVNVNITEPGNTRTYKGRKCRFDIHSLRVYGVSYLVELGIPFHVVQLIVGHVTAAMTVHYNKPSADFMRQVIMEKVGASDLLGSWDEIAADILKEKRYFIATNSAFKEGNHIPDNLLDGDYKGFVEKPGGLCPVGGDACDIGGLTEVIAVKGSKAATVNGPVVGGCGNCRFFCTTPAHLFQHQMTINDLLIQIRSVGKRQTSIAERLSELQWQDENNPVVARETAMLKSEIEDIERQLEPLVREWMNRLQMAMKTIEQLDDYREFINDRKEPGSSVVLLSSSTAEELAPHIELRMENTGEFELARQTLLAAHIQGGIDHCSELSRQQLREFMDRIMYHEDPRFMLVGIHDQKTRDNVAFLMAETMAAMAGTASVQEALDKGTGLNLGEQKSEELLTWVKGLFSNANEQGVKSTLSSLLPPSLKVESET